MLRARKCPQCDLRLHSGCGRVPALPFLGKTHPEFPVGGSDHPRWRHAVEADMATPKRRILTQTSKRNRFFHALLACSDGTGRDSCLSTMYRDCLLSFFLQSIGRRDEVSRGTRFAEYLTEGRVFLSTTQVASAKTQSSNPPLPCSPCSMSCPPPVVYPLARLHSQPSLRNRPHEPSCSVEMTWKIWHPRLKIS